MFLTKHFLRIVLLLFVSFNLFGQAPNLQLTLRYNTSLLRYEVYALPDASQSNFNWGPSQISVLAPASVPDAPFNVTSVAGGAWQDNSNIYAPTAAPGSDFHGIGSLGANTSLSGNMEKLVFHFTLPGGGCTPGLRLYINGVDPNSSAPGMAGGDFSNTIFAVVPGMPMGYEAYVGNYNNNGTSCNAPIVANDDTITTPEDTPLTFNPLANDTDANNNIDPASVTVISLPANGTVVVNPVSGEITFSPNLNFNGSNTFSYAVCDTGTPIYCDTANVAVTVTPVNDAPVAGNDAATIAEDMVATVNAIANDMDVDGAVDPATLDLDPATAGVQTSFLVAGQGTYTVNPMTGVVSFTPVTNFNGTSSTTYVICDNGAPLPSLCDTASITVTVMPVNDPPTITQGPVSTPEETPVVICPTTADVDAGDVLTVTTCNTPANGTAVNGPGNCITFTPALDFTGTTTVCIQVCDQTGACDSVLVPITVTPVNDPPTITQDPVSTPEETPVVICPTTADTDAGDILTVTTCNTPANGTAVNGPGNCITFTPALNFTGTTTVCIQVCDQTGACDSVLVSVTVTPVNDAPVAGNDIATVAEDMVATVNAIANDMDVDGAVDPATLDLDPATTGVQTSFLVAGQGTYTVNPMTGVVSFTPVTNFNGTSSTTYVICDNGTPLPSLCDTASITVTVMPVNDLPVANADIATTPEDTPVTFNVTTNDTDVDGIIDPATLDLDPATAGVQQTFTVAGQGTFVANPANGAVTFTPVSNFSGSVVISYNVCDNGSPLPAQCDTALITLSVIFDPIAKLQLKVMLQGALTGTGNGLMRDDLRAGGYLPLTEPYTVLGMSNPRFTHVNGGGETTTAGVLAANAGTPNAIVDWVFVELRSALDSSVVLQTRSALVQRDGDVVSSTDGTSRLFFNGLVGQQYFIAIKHRNHLGAMTSGKVLMNNDSTLLDLTNATGAQFYNRPGSTNYDGMETVAVEGKRALWSANANTDLKVKYQGTASDNIPVLTQSLAHPGNTAGTYNYNAALGYYTGDVNMDGKVKYQGPSNDVTFVFVNVVGLYTALNVAALYNYDLFIEQLP